MESDYIIETEEKSFCPKCHQRVDLLAPGVSYANRSNAPDKTPWFYICWACKFVAQVGVGPVGREDV